MDPIHSMIEEGAAAIDSLQSHSSRLMEVIAQTFPHSTLADVAKAMAPMAESKGKANEKVASLSNLVREESAAAVTIFRAVEMWIRLKAPAISDGNNFGVDVQNYVLTELQTMRGAMEAMVVASRDYHWSRAQGLDKLLGSDSADNSSSESTTKEKDAEGKETTKSSSTTSSKKSSGTPPGYPDYKEYVVALDVKQYHSAFNQLTDIKNNYVKAHVLFLKNMKRLSNPRGEEDDDGRSAHAMSMF
jgi:hypothetical protein